MRDQDWNPRSEAVLEDQQAAYDDMRRRCPVAWSEQLGWSLFRHADVLRVLEDHETFSNPRGDSRVIGGPAVRACASAGATSARLPRWQSIRGARAPAAAAPAIVRCPEW